MRATPPPMSENGFQASREALQAHDHAVCAYDSPESFARSLGAFLRAGLEKRDLMVFVHSMPTEEDAWTLLENAHKGARDLTSSQLVVVSLYKDAFEGGRGRIDYEHVTSVVESLLQRANTARHGGVRLFVDASRTYFAERRTREWFEFESWLGRRLHHSVGLVCAYRHADVMQPDIFPDVLRTHAYRFEGK